MNAPDHPPAHFHIVGPKGDALIDLATMSVMRGRLVDQAAQSALAWAMANRPAIIAEWNKLHPRFPIV